MRDTSIAAYKSINHELASKQKEVLEVLKLSPKSNSEIASTLGWQINRVTGRVNELVNSGVVKAVGKKRNRITQRMEYVWTVA